MTLPFTVILPHKRNAGNNAALALCMQCLMENTRSEFRLLMSAAYDQPLYSTINQMVWEAPTDCCLYLNSDMFVAPNWDVEMLACYDEQTWVTNVLVEPGAIALHAQNLHHDFGRKPSTFQRTEFELWCKYEAPMLEGEGWYCPVMFSREGWLEMGGHDTSLGEWHEPGTPPLDMLLFEKWKATGHFIRRAHSYTYHLQRYSDPEEQMHEKRG